jgi:hypothetical protein
MWTAERMESILATVTEFEERVRNGSRAVKHENGAAAVEWSPKVARTEFITLNRKLKQLYGQELIPIIKELGYSTNDNFQIDSQKVSAESDDWMSSLVISIVITISFLCVCVYLYSYFDESEPHIRSNSLQIDNCT